MKILLITIISFVFYTSLSAQNIHRTTCNGNLVRLDSMLTNSIIDIKDDRGSSLLHWAVACKQKEVFDFLIKKGIKINEINNQGKTPLHVAVQFNNVEYFDYLIKLQPNNDWQPNYGALLFELAVLNGNKEFIEKLIISGTDINIKNQRGSTALDISQRIGSENISEFLIAKGADESLVRKFKIKDLKRTKLSDITLFRLNSKDSPYSKKNEFRLVKSKNFSGNSRWHPSKDKNTIDYIDYAILISNSAALIKNVKNA